MRSCKLVATSVLLSLFSLGVNAAECRDERLTKAIERVSGRMPIAAECNLAIYRLPPDHPQFDAAVKDGLLVLKKVFVDGRPATQKLWRYQEPPKQAQK